MEATYEFRLLGPLEARVDARPLALGGPKQRAVLALLLLQANEVVTAERLIDGLWAETPPPTARETIKVYVGRLRKLFPAGGPPPRIVTRGGGYALELDPEQIDLKRFVDLAGAGARAFASGDAEQAAAAVDEALALWRGTPLADLGDAAFAAAERERLEEMRLAAIETGIEACLLLGGEATIVGDLERLVREHPFRERFRAQLMLALYRCGRQAEALEHYRRAAKLFVDELGIGPGRELRELERAILEQEPSLRCTRLAEPHLPAPPTRLIGRERELSELVALLETPETRLVTVVGPGGAGKTRLALEAAAAAGIPAYFVDLAPLSDSGAVVPAIARAVGLDDGEAAIEQAVSRFLASQRRLLLLLDNFEHVLPAAADVAAMLSAAPGTKVVATSRSPLRIRAERRFELGALGRDDATALFLDRARAVRRDFSPTPAVEELCRRLDSLPLPIELAAAHIDRLTPEEMLASLDRSLDVLAEGACDLPERQRTLRATLDWSYALLDEAARDLLARLAVFGGGWTSDAAEAVCGATPSRVGALLDAAIVRREGGRFTMLETIREYALELLRSSGREDDLRRSHARHYADLLDEARPLIGRAPTIAYVAAEDDNVNAALAWTRAAGERGLQLRLVAASAPFWLLRGRLHEADAWLRPAVAAAEAAPPALRAALLSAAASVSGRLGDLGRANDLATEAWELCRACGDHRGAATALSAVMRAAAQGGDLARRDALLEQLDHATRELDAPVLRSGTLRAVGSIVARAGDHERGQALAEESLAVARAAGLELDVGQALCHLGIIALQAGRADEARGPLEESLEIAHRLTYREAAAYSLSGLAALAVAEDDVQQATQLLAAADALFADVGTSRLPFISDLDARTRAAVGEGALAAAVAEAGEATFDELVGRGIAVAHR